MPPLPFTCTFCRTQQHADGICANCGRNTVMDTRAMMAAQQIAGEFLEGGTPLEHNDIAAIISRHFPPTAPVPAQTWCDHCSADLNDTRHILCERCYREYAGPKWCHPAFNSEPIMLSARDFQRFLAALESDAEPNEKLKALFKVEANQVETAPAGVEAPRIYPISCQLHPEGYHTACAEVNRYIELCATPAPAESGEVKRLREALRAYRKIVKAWQSHVLTTSRLLGCAAIDKDVEAAIDKLKHDFTEARSKAIAECVEAAQSVIKGWRSDVDESWDERPDLSFEAADKIAGAQEIVTALERLSLKADSND